MKVIIRTVEGYVSDLDLNYEEFMKLFRTGWWEPPGHPGHRVEMLQVLPSETTKTAKTIFFA